MLLHSSRYQVQSLKQSIQSLRSNNNKKLLEKVTSKLNITSLEDWYRVTAKDVVRIGGRSLLEEHHSLIGMLSYHYPDHSWELWKFKIVKNAAWKDIDTQRLVMDEIGRNLGVQTLDDWYKVERRDVLRQPKGASILQQHRNSLYLSTI